MKIKKFMDWRTDNIRYKSIVLLTAVYLLVRYSQLFRFLEPDGYVVRLFFYSVRRSGTDMNILDVFMLVILNVILFFFADGAIVSVYENAEMIYSRGIDRRGYFARCSLRSVVAFIFWWLLMCVLLICGTVGFKAVFGNATIIRDIFGFLIYGSMMIMFAILMGIRTMKQKVFLVFIIIVFVMIGMANMGITNPMILIININSDYEELMINPGETIYIVDLVLLFVMFIAGRKQLERKEFYI